jgi:hypothetical protein
VLGSAVVYSGLIIALVGLIFVIKPIRRLRIPTRPRGAAVAAFGVVLVVIGLILPAPQSRISRVQTRLDEFVPAWQFREFHALRVAAPPARTFEAIQRVRADEISFFRTLTWIRRGGRPLPESILNAGAHESLIDVATRTGFIRLAEDPPRELVIGTVVAAPPGTRGRLTPEVFRSHLPPGFALAAMNFIVTPRGQDQSIVSTETRVFANSPSARRRFAAYWRVIYPGSAIIRRSWLRAIERRAVSTTARRAFPTSRERSDRRL